MLDTQMKAPPAPLGEAEVLVQMVFRAGQSKGVFSCVCLICWAAALLLLVHHSPSHPDQAASLVDDKSTNIPGLAGSSKITVMESKTWNTFPFVVVSPGPPWKAG